MDKINQINNIENSYIAKWLFVLEWWKLVPITKETKTTYTYSYKWNDWIDIVITRRKSDNMKKWDEWKMGWYNNIAKLYTQNEYNKKLDEIKQKKQELRFKIIDIAKNLTNEELLKKYNSKDLEQILFEINKIYKNITWEDSWNK